MRKWLNNYFDFSKSEFNGLLALIIVIVLITFAPNAYSIFYPNGGSDEEQLVMKRLILVENSESVRAVSSHRSYGVQAHIRSVRKVNLFRFDPNTIGIDDWISLGLSPKQAAGVVKYTSKGGKFKTAADLRKMYTISSQLADKLIPYVSIKEENLTFKASVDKKVTSSKPAKRLIELNFADSADLDEIKGVGPAFAIRIIKYRDRIGGFYRKEQLLEVFGIDSTKYAEIKDQISVDDSAIKKINVNTAQIEDFKNHPYIRYKQANALLAYRKQHGNFNSIADLSKISILTPDLILRLTPYLSF
ncbi:ComEA family DNA-binding protein [Pedobacter sp. PWIIR3]